MKEMTTIKITRVGSAEAELVDKKDFFGALKSCNPVSNIITIKGRQYQLNSAALDCETPDCLIYEALLTQKGAAAPEAIVLNSTDKNFLKVDSWNYVDAGKLVAITNQEFPEQTRMAYAAQVQGTHISTLSKGPKEVIFEIQDLKDSTYVDGRLNLTYVCIKVKSDNSPEMKKMFTEIIAKEDAAAAEVKAML